jgi:hypothetical protein
MSNMRHGATNLNCINCLYRAPRYEFITMKSILFVGIIAAVIIAGTASFGLDLAFAQMADNATMGNVTGGNMTMGTGNMSSGSSEDTGNISGFGGVL